MSEMTEKEAYVVRHAAALLERKLGERALARELHGLADEHGAAQICEICVNPVTGGGTVCDRCADKLAVRVGQIWRHECDDGAAAYRVERIEDAFYANLVKLEGHGPHKVRQPMRWLRGGKLGWSLHSDAE